ncbi:hypothetical protein M569_04757 [Genlisea aurea]|uniref:Uncharacterized protein n=1 Tax=Genlisea aurea TaxID=192259 RepID=S8CT41_9LAMI|nr:hypothetical protein M569_04757 [Genlisea aurea]
MDCDGFEEDIDFDESGDREDFSESEYEVDVENLGIEDYRYCSELAIAIVGAEIEDEDQPFESDVGGSVSDPEADTLNSDREEHDRHRFFDPNIAGKLENLVVGIKFRCRDEMRDAIKAHLFHQGKEVKFTAIDPVRVIAKCKTPGCTFYAYGSKPKQGGVWQLKTFQRQHVNETLYFYIFVIK